MSPNGSDICLKCEVKPGSFRLRKALSAGQLSPLDTEVAAAALLGLIGWVVTTHHSKVFYQPKQADVWEQQAY